MAAREMRRVQEEAESIWLKCPACQEILFRKEVERRLFVCPKCSAHLRLTVEQRLLTVVDRGSFVEHDATLSSRDALGFTDRKPYTARLAEARRKTGRREAVICGTATILGRPVALGVFDFAFFGGSMGAVVGEKLTRIVEHALAARLPVILFAASGGARMQEGVLSLMQMAKVSVALGLLRAAGLPYLSVLTDPTTGGVAASLGMLGDINIAEPHALIGFAGPRVIEQTIREKLPPGFQRAEFLLEHGMVDLVVERKDLRRVLSQLLGLLCD
ncbi:MAG: acetyl-CoA carboxylase, carboxyltransferase subunit beta [Thermodesulfobacteriota bacterium]|jgi:acetyl-CoA carboxylase carboxyl transferase subunit beta